MSAKVVLLGVAESLTIRLAHYADRLDTYVQTKAGAARYAAGPGRKPTKAELARYREIAAKLRQR